MTNIPSTLSLLHGDAHVLMRDMPSDTFDAVITDPPYASGGLTTAERVKDPVAKYQVIHDHAHPKPYPTFCGDCRDQRSHFVWSCDWMREAFRCVKPGGFLMVFSDWRQLPLTSDAMLVSGWLWRGIVTWDKTEACRPQLGLHRNQAEYVLVATKGHRRTGSGAEVRVSPAGVYRTYLRPADKLHLTGKPVDLMEHLMAILAPHSAILDPFAWSGTTLLAARNLGHDCTGVEMSDAYYTVAKSRLGL